MLKSAFISSTYQRTLAHHNCKTTSVTCINKYQQAFTALVEYTENTNSYVNVK